MLLFTIVNTQGIKMKAIILARISSDEQKDGHSLEAQIRNLKLYAEQKNLIITKEFTLVESSTKQRRPEFERMIDFIKTQKEKIALVVDTVDRLQRSFRETPTFNELMEKDLLELHFVKEGNILSKDANSSQKLMWNMGVVMAQSYTDQLSDNIKRSVNFKVRNGGWCGQAPIGYTNVVDSDSGKASIEPDVNNAHLVRKLFIEYSKGTYSLKLLSEASKQWGLCSRKGFTIGPQYLHGLLQNPFYYGVMRFKEKLYPHNYTPLIPKELYDKCQKIMLKRGKRRNKINTKHPYLFRELITCAVSKRLVTSDLKKGKYCYLICRNPQNPSKKLWVQENEVIKQVEIALKKIKISDENYKKVTEKAQQLSTTYKSERQKNLFSLQKEQANIESQIDKLTDLLINDGITREVYDRKYTQLKRLSDKVALDLQEQSDDTKDFERALLTILLLCNRALDLFKSSKINIKRALMETLFSNLQLEGKKLEYSLVSPVSQWETQRGYKEWWREQDSNLRTLARAELQSAAINHSTIPPQGIKKRLKELS